MGLRDDIQAKLKARDNEVEAKKRASQADFERQNEIKTRRSTEALHQFLQDETLRKIVDFHIDTVGGPQVATVLLRGGKVSMARPQGGAKAEIELDIPFVADPLTASTLLATPPFVQRIGEVRSEGVEITIAEPDLKNNLLVLTIDYRGL